MLSDMEPRYRGVRVLRQHADRLVAEATDTLTDTPVVLKADRGAYIRREMETLLALPPGVGPALRDAAWTPAGRLVLVLERLPGRSLLAAAPETDPALLPEIVSAIGCRLGQLHRAGFVHADLKPSNVFLLRDSEASDVRLLDFGAAIGRTRDPRADPVAGGTPPYAAPEVACGWIADGRADQFSLGIFLRELFPHLDQDPAWGRLIDRLSQRVAVQRFPDIADFRRALAEVFGERMFSGGTPQFGAGPLRGRSAEAARILEHLESAPARRVLLQARPHTGLSRLLLETVLRVAGRGGPPLRLIDLSGNGSGGDADQLRGLAQAAIADGSALLCGVPDPSPGLHWLDGRQRSWLHEVFGTPETARITLPALDLEAFIEIVTDSLGAGGAEVDDLARVLHSRTHADLRIAADGFRWLAKRSCRERGVAWLLDAEKLREACMRWAPEPPAPHLAEVAEALRAPLQIFALAGSSLPDALARSLAEQFATATDLERLLDHGYLLPEPDSRLAFVTPAFWAEAASVPHPAASAIDAWLHENLVPDPRRIVESLRACDRARRRGDRPREREIFSAAYAAARDERRWHDLRRLFAYPGCASVERDPDRALEQAEQLAALLGQGWEAADLLYDFGRSLMSLDPLRGSAVLEAVMRSESAAVSTAAMVRLLERAVARRDEAAYERYLEALTERERTGNAPPHPGVLDYYRALHALNRGSEEAADRDLHLAAERLAGSSTLQEGLALQFLAVRTFGRDPQRGIALMRDALDRTCEWERSAQIRHNLCAMYQQVGDHLSAVACAEEGISRLRGRITPARLATLQLRRGWSWWALGRHAAAIGTARDLLDLGAVRRNGPLRVGARLLLGHGYLHHHNSPVAVAETARAWADAAQGCPVDLRSDALSSLCDVLLDLDAWVTVREHGESLRMSEGQESAHVRLANARAEALRAQAAAAPRDALQVLEHAAGAAGEVVSRPLLSRYHHHVGCAHLACAVEPAEDRQSQAATALAAFEKALAVLPAGCHVYNRGRTMQCKAQALALLGEPERARALLEEAIAAARGAECQGLLAGCLRQRSALNLGVQG